MHASRPIHFRLKLMVLFGASLSGAQQLGAQEGEMTVQVYCSPCHSLALVYSQNGDETFWRDTIDLMRAKHNLGPIPVERETVIIDFLAKRSTVKPTLRRAPLEAGFLPQVVRHDLDTPTTRGNLK